jgi:cell division control protein 11
MPICSYSIPVYNFPYDVEEDDPLTVSENQALRALLPFAIVGSNEELEIDGELVRVRRLPWGVVEVDNPKHSDFGALRNALLRCVKPCSRTSRFESDG